MSRQQEMSYSDRIQELLRLSQTLDWTTQAQLLHEEERFHFFSRRNVLFFDEMTAATNRYLALGSLPFFIKDPSDVAWVETMARYRNKLYDIWPNEWLDSSNKSKEEYHGRLPTLPRGNMRPRFMIIGDAPGIGKSPGNFDRTMTWGPTSHMLRKALLSQNLYYQSWFTNLVKVSQYKNTPTTKEDIVNWRPYLLREIRELDPKVFILLGNHVYDMFRQYYLVPLGASVLSRSIKIPHPSWVNRKDISFSEYGEIMKAELLKIDAFY